MPEDNQNRGLDKTELKQVELYRDRWSTFGEGTGIRWISNKPSPEDLKQFDLFKPYEDSFLEDISSDLSIAKWKANSVLFEEGTYIDLAFYVADGEVEVSLEAVAGASPQVAPIVDKVRTAMVAQPVADRIEATAEMSTRTRIVSPKDILFLSMIDANLKRGEIRTLEREELFGEIGAMSGWPQSVTARTRTDCTLVQIRLPALRRLRFESDDFRERLDRTYRQRCLSVQLKSTPIFSQCPDEAIEKLKDEVELVSYEKGESIVREGEPVDALYLVRSGFVKLAQEFVQDEITVTYLSKGMTLGDVELMVLDLEQWAVTGTSVEHSELVKIPRDVLTALLKSYPRIEHQLQQTGKDRWKEIRASRRDLGRSEFTDMALADGLVQGNSILVIDLNVCTRCDDCVRACAATHDGLPRFVREGSKYNNLLIAKSCYHCRDPVCLVGCPTGAIRRSGALDVVEIAEDICIGCRSCAESCPYDQIVMVDTGTTWPEDAMPDYLRPDPETHEPKKRLVASKCDLCKDTGHGPACVSNCPQGCAFRVGTLDEFDQLLQHRPEGRTQ